MLVQKAMSPLASCLDHGHVQRPGWVLADLVLSAFLHSSNPIWGHSYKYSGSVASVTYSLSASLVLS